MQIKLIKLLQVPDTPRPDLSNKSEFIPKGLFYGEKRPSLNISHASNLRPYSSNTDSGPYTVSCPVGTGGSLPGDRVTGA
jgi:hypothetical protein